MGYGWMLAALTVGLWTGLLLPRLTQTAQKRQEQKVIKQAEQQQEQVLNEWLYGEKTEIGG